MPLIIELMENVYHLYSCMICIVLICCQFNAFVSYSCICSYFVTNVSKNDTHLDLTSNAFSHNKYIACWNINEFFQINCN